MTSPNWPASCSEFAPRPGRLALFLEGGYDAAALASSVEATLGALLGRPTRRRQPTYGRPGAGRVASGRTTRRRAIDGLGAWSERPALLGSLSDRFPARRLSRAAMHEHRAVCVGDAVLADRADQHADELTVAAAADDEQVGALGGLDEGRVRDAR